MMTSAELIVSREGRIGRIRLNRPKALNSLTLDMVRGFTRALADFAANPEIVAVLVTGEGERGLCAGGDIRRLYDLRDGDKTYYEDFWREEYQLDAMIARYQKPYVVVMDGLVMGGGVGISAHGNCRIVTERTRLAMPETGIGFIPDVGGTWLLTRAGGVGVYLALSGAAISAGDALHAGLADVFIDSRHLGELIRRLSIIGDAPEAKDLLQRLARQVEPGEYAQHREMLERVMSEPRVEDILAALDSTGSDFAQKAAKELRSKSPTSLKVTIALLKRAMTAPNLEACLVNEFRAACGLLRTHDLYEGIRAAVVDKDRSPKWRPSTLDEVDDATVREILAGAGAPEPRFPRLS
ncbi:enoyl-CoA hydratase/isomerase family protein [Methylocystis sp. JAN1]|uniref:enoyl-CoA hydratase/isomerase family protein n=1 Tax=Methylocystis sp. JAN1 TaxID=3397211 RepID=UPI003FA23BBC